MKLTTTKLILNVFAAVLILGLSACKKENYPIGTLPSYGKEQVTQFFDDNETPSQKKTINTGSAQTIIADLGTRFTFPENAFVYSNGNPVVGPVDIEIKELYTLDAMIFSNKMTVSGGQYLGSGGELFVEATQNGQRVELAPGKNLVIEVPTTNGLPQMAFFGGEQTANGFDWTPDPTVPLNVVVDTISQSEFYSIITDTLWSWINCDYFANYTGQRTSVEIQVPSGKDPSNTAVFGYVPSINSVFRAGGGTFQNGSFWLKNGYDLPVGLNVYFIGIYYDANKNIEYSLQNATIVNNHVEVLNFSPITKAQLQTLLQSL